MVLEMMPLFLMSNAAVFRFFFASERDERKLRRGLE